MPPHGLERGNKIASIAILILVLRYVDLTAADPVGDCKDRGERYFAADSEQCDKFHICLNGKSVSQLLCQDGLVFLESASQCVYPFNVDCSNRKLLQRPKISGNCQRLNGKWSASGTCHQYYDCAHGIERLVTCQNHLIYDDKTGNCEHPDTANRDGCKAEERYGFICPKKEDILRAESDCRAFFICSALLRFKPRLGGCPDGAVFNPQTKRCDQPKNVPGCETYYDS